MTTLPARPKIYIQEVATRDGFQNEAQFIETQDKVRVVDALSDCGFAKIEVTSFTSPKAIPALRDAEMLMHEIKRVPGVEYTSETHNRANLRMTREQSFAQLKQVISAIAGSHVAINISLSTSFGCPMEGNVEQDEVMRWMERFANLGVQRATLCDTTGMAYPSQVKALARRAKTLFPQTTFTLHFHNTRAMAQTNVMAALSEGIERFDASLGGIGGCPYAPGASGNACTEDMVHLLELEGYDTGVDLTKVLAVSALLPGLIGHDVPSQLLKAGKRDRRYPAPDYTATLGQA
jgi:hydroxymethylglutaryl-CoA lyase